MWFRNGDDAMVGLLRPSFVIFLAIVCGVLYFTTPSANAIGCAIPGGGTNGTIAGSIDCFVPSGALGNIVSLRDISDTSNSTETVTVNLDKAKYAVPDSGQVTISNIFADLDSTVPDTVKAKITSSSDPVGISVLATESGSSTSTFVGAFSTTSGASNGTKLHVSHGDSVTVNYSPAPNFAQRFQLTFDNAGADGNAIIGDLMLTSDDEINNGFSTVVESSNFTLTNGTTLNSGSTEHIVISYANAQLGCLVDVLSGCNTDNLSLWVSPPSSSPFHTFVEIADAATVTNNPVAKTVSFDTDLTSIDSSTSGSWLFVLAFDTGGIGGSGGGIVSRGFVLNFLAGIPGVTGNTVSPPSFGGNTNHYDDGLTLTFGDNDKQTFDASKYNQELPKQVMVAGMPVNMTFKTYESYNKNGVIHMGLYIIPRGQDMITSNSLASIIWEKGKDTEVIDPNHIISNSSASSTTNGKFQYTQFSFTPKKSYDKMSFLVKAWNDHLYSTDIRFHDAITTPEQLVNLPDGVIKYDSFAALSAAIQQDGFSKPQILSHIHDTSTVFGSAPGNVYWVYDTRDHTVTLVLEDGNGKVIDMKLEALVAQQVSPQQNYVLGNMVYSHHSLSRDNTNELEDAKSAEAIKALDLLTGLYGTNYFEQYGLVSK